MNVRWIVMIATVMCAVAIFVLWLIPIQNNDSIENHEVKFSNTQEDKSHHVLKHKNLENVQQRLSHFHIPQQELLDAYHQTILFDEVNYEDVKSQLWLSLNDQQKDDGRLFIKYDPLTIETKSIGDQVQFQAFALGVNRKGTITDFEKVDQNIYRWSGHFGSQPSQNNHFRITQSLSDQYTLMMIYTEHGVYELESKNGIGWIKPSRFIENDVMVDHYH